MTAILRHGVRTIVYCCLCKPLQYIKSLFASTGFIYPFMRTNTGTRYPSWLKMSLFSCVKGIRILIWICIKVHKTRAPYALLSAPNTASVNPLGRSCQPPCAAPVNPLVPPLSAPYAASLSPSLCRPCKPVCAAHFIPYIAASVSPF
jgi:hypothetical protein